MPDTDLHAAKRLARTRYADRHAQDDPLPDPELVACHVRLPAYLEPEAHLVPIPEPQPTTAQVAYCIRNRDRGAMREGDRGKLGSEV